MNNYFLSTRARNCRMSSLVVGALSPEREAAAEEGACDGCSERGDRSIAGCARTLTCVPLMCTKMNRAKIAAARMMHSTITTYTACELGRMLDRVLAVIANTSDVFAPKLLAIDLAVSTSKLVLEDIAERKL